MLSLTIPTIFTGVDKLSPLFTKLGSDISSFASKAEAAAARGNRAFNKFTPTLSETSHKVLDVLATYKSAETLFEGIKFSGEALVEFDTALSSLRVKLAGLSDKDFAKFQDKINQVAFATKESSVEVAEGFEKILSLNRKFGETAEGLGEVSKASIILSKVSKSDVATSAENLVGVMNQFNLAADQSDRVINVLTASQSKSSSSIANTSAALSAFGPIAKHYNVTLEQSVGLIDVLAEKQITGERAGTALSGAIIKLQHAHAGYKSGVFNLGDALDQVKGKLDKFSTAKERDNFVSALFGKRQQATGILLLENIDKIKKYTDGVSGTTEAERLAEISENNLGSRITQLKNKWVDMITSQDKANGGLSLLKNTIVFVTDHLGTIVSIGAGVLAFFGAWKLLLISTEAILGLYNIGLGVMGAITGVANIAIGQSAIALGAYNIVMGIATAATWLWNAALAVNPIVWVIAAIMALVAIIYYWSDITAWFSKIWKKFVGFLSDVWKGFLDFFSQFDWKGTFMKIGGYILDFLLLPIKAVLKLVSLIPGTVGDVASKALNGINDFTTSMEVDHNISQKQPLMPPSTVVAQMQAQRQQESATSKQYLGIDINDPNGWVKGVSAKGPLNPNVNVTTTQGQK